MSVVGKKEVVEDYAKEMSISKAEAEKQVTTLLEIIATKCVEGGVSFKGLFTIKKKVQKGREGKCNGHAYKTDDKNTLSFKVGSDLDKELNK